MPSPPEPLLSADDVHGWREHDALSRIARVVVRLPTPHKNTALRWLGRRFGAGSRSAVRTLDGHLLAVDPRCLGLAGWIQQAGTWEPWVVETCRLLARPGDVFVDAGAHVGCVS